MSEPMQARPAATRRSQRAHQQTLRRRRHRRQPRRRQNGRQVALVHLQQQRSPLPPIETPSQTLRRLGSSRRSGTNTWATRAAAAWHRQHLQRQQRRGLCRQRHRRATKTELQREACVGETADVRRNPEQLGELDAADRRDPAGLIRCRRKRTATLHGSRIGYDASLQQRASRHDRPAALYALAMPLCSKKSHCRAHPILRLRMRMHNRRQMLTRRENHQLRCIALLFAGMDVVEWPQNLQMPRGMRAPTRPRRTSEERHVVQKTSNLDSPSTL